MRYGADGARVATVAVAIIVLLAGLMGASGVILAAAGAHAAPNTGAESAA
jgi:hypothetical protein